LPLRGKAAARILHDHPITTLDKVVDVPWARSQMLVIRQARQQDRKAPWRVRAIDVSAQCHPITGLHGNIFFNQDAILGTTSLWHRSLLTLTDSFGYN